MQQLLEKLKQKIIEEIENGVCIFDKAKPMCLATVWWKLGIGYWLFQKHCECETLKPFGWPTGWRVILVGSRFTTSAESHYAPIEGEALAVPYGLDNEDTSSLAVTTSQSPSIISHFSDCAPTDH